MQDAWRAYLELALGLTEASKKHAQAVARRLVGSSGVTAAQLQTMAEELISTGMANREALTRIVRVEVDRTLGRLGLATTDEVAALTERVRGLERELAATRAATTAGPVGATGASDTAGPDGPTAGGSVAKKAVAKRVAGQAVATRAVATRKSTSRKATVTKRLPAPGDGARTPVERGEETGQ